MVIPQPKKYGQCNTERGCRAIRRAYLDGNGKYHCMACGRILKDVREYTDGEIEELKRNDGKTDPRRGS